MIDIDYYLSSRVSLCEITNSIGNFTQAVTSVDHRRDFPLCYERCNNI